VGHINGVDDRMKSIPRKEQRKLQIKVMLLLIKIIVVIIVH